jgi:hypothetical protein
VVLVPEACLEGAAPTTALPSFDDELEWEQEQAVQKLVKKFPRLHLLVAFYGLAARQSFLEDHAEAANAGPVSSWGELMSLALRDWQPADGEPTPWPVFPPKP